MATGTDRLEGRSLAVHFGWVSLLQDLGSKMVVPIVPIFITVGLGGSALIVGIVDGVAAATVAVVAPVAGRLTTPQGAPRLVRLGYGMSSVAKLALAAASAWGAVLAIRVLDRLGKGVRDTPRDLLLAGSTRAGRAFGIQQAMDKVGGAAGPLVGLAVYRSFGGSFDAVFIAAFIPCAVSVLLLWRPLAASPERPAPAVAAGAMSARQRRMVLVVGSGAALTVPVSLVIVRSLEEGASVTHVLVAFALLRLATALVAIPAGLAADRVGPGNVLAAGHLALAAALFAAGLGGGRVIWFVLPAVGVADALIRGPMKAWLTGGGSTNSRGRALGSWTGVQAAGALVAGVAAGLAWGSDGTVPLLVSGASVGVVGCLVWLSDASSRPCGLVGRSGRGPAGGVDGPR